MFPHRLKWLATGAIIGQYPLHPLGITQLVRFNYEPDLHGHHQENRAMVDWLD